MQFQYCPDCGTKLVDKPFKYEGDIPFCDSCRKYHFPVFKVAVLVLVVNPYGKIAVLKQPYLSKTYRNLVSGFMDPGENALKTAHREVQEELGIKVYNEELVHDWWIDGKDLLMLGILAETDETELHPNYEVASAEWVTPEEGLNLTERNGTAYQLIETYLKHKKAID